jgi:hypothetical protein
MATVRSQVRARWPQPSQDDPVIAWIFPDQHRRRAVLPAFMEFRLRKLAFPHDQVWMTADGAPGAAGP